MIDLIKHENLLELVLPGATLRNASCLVTLEDAGEVALALGEIERGEGFVRVALSHEALHLKGSLTLTEGEDFCDLSLSLRGECATFASSGAFAGRSSFVLRVGEIEGMNALLAEYLFCPWWTRPAFPKALREVPQKTQLLLCRTAQNALFALPLVADRFKVDLCGDDSGLRIAAHANDCGLVALDGKLIAFAADEDPFTAVENAYARCVENGLIRSPLKSDKEYPEMMEYLGWCSWNAFYHEVDAAGLTAKLDELKQKQAPIRWLLIDDGWSPVEDSALTAFEEDRRKFPEGLKAFVRKAHEEYGIGQVGVWHAFNAYWEGIKNGSPLARQMAHTLTATKDGHLLPGFSFHQAFEFFNAWHSYLREQGIDFVKVDNQSSAINLIRNNAPIRTLFELHKALEASVRLNFTAPLINCMGMANENAFSREWSMVSRSSDDFFPNQEGSFVSHIMQNAYNSVFYDQLFVCDYDMWWTSHPSAVVSGVLRAISGGPIYVSDKVGETDPDMLLPLVEADGRIIRCDHAAKPAARCLFEDVPNESGVLHLTNRCGVNAVNAAFNLTKEAKRCTVRFEDTECEPGQKYLAYLHFAKRYVTFDQPIELTLPADGVEVISLYPIENGQAIVGDERKYISAGSRDLRTYTL